MKDGITKVLYVSPEQLNNENSVALIRSRKIALLAVDEAHCISEWGHGKQRVGREQTQHTHNMNDAHTHTCPRAHSYGPL